MRAVQHRVCVIKPSTDYCRTAARWRVALYLFLYQRVLYKNDTQYRRMLAFATNFMTHIGVPLWAALMSSTTSADKHCAQKEYKNIMHTCNEPPASEISVTTGGRMNVSCSPSTFLATVDPDIIHNSSHPQCFPVVSSSVGGSSANCSRRSSNISGPQSHSKSLIASIAFSEGAGCPHTNSAKGLERHGTGLSGNVCNDSSTAHPTSSGVYGAVTS